MRSNNFSEAKNELLTKWLQGQMDNYSATIRPRPQNNTLPLSLPQQRQLFLELLEPGTAVNNLSMLVQLNGKLDFVALEQSANLIIARHDVLRMSFSFSQGLPQASVCPQLKVNIPVIDLQEIEISNQVDAARRHAEQEVSKPFDLGRAPLVRLTLYALQPDAHFLLLCVHHTIADGWSFGIFLKELMMFYQHLTAENPLNVPDLTIQYADFANWQNQTVQDNSLTSSMNYWRQQLSGELPILDLPSDHPRLMKQTFAGATHRFTLSKSLTEGLKNLCQQEDASMFMTLLTAFNVLLHRYSLQDDILVGSPVANRNLPEIEDLIGVFINTIVLRANLSADPDFRDLLKQVRETALEAYAHQDLPFEKLVEELKPKRDLSRTPIFQVMFNLQNSPVPTLESPSLSMIPLEIDRGVSQFDLTLMLTQRDGKFDGTVEYNRDLFECDTIQRMFDSYQLLLQEILIHPERPISALKILTEDVMSHILHDLNRTDLNVPKNKCIHQLFEEQALANPDKIALLFNEYSLTYFELNCRSNLLARKLRDLGVRPGIRVGVIMERSLEIPAVLLGIMKAGGTYVPIHCTVPAEQLKFILEDAGLHLLLINFDADIPENTNTQIIKLNEDNTVTGGDSSNLQSTTSTEHLAYIIYTSGSTGKPKGVMVPHSALVNCIWSMKQEPGLVSDDVLLSVTPISFDIAALELFLPLITGATVVLAGKETTANPALIAEAIQRYQVSIMQATPASWQLLIESGWAGSHGLKALCGGDVLTRKLADQLLNRVGTLWNMYGPTETTIWSSINLLQKENKPVTIGKPVGNTQVYVLDRYMQPTPAGVAGELYIGGAGVALGYLNRKELTNEKFIQDCFSSTPGARLFKTGDMARYLPDYSIEILGRNDLQVKVNGHRVELGEIETTIRNHPAIRDAIVVTRSETSGDKRLAAYYVTNDHQTIEAADLQNFIRKKLPSYMVPTSYFLLDKLPLSAHGKIDRSSLPDPGSLHRSNDNGTPRNETEEVLAEIWEKVLNVKQVGIHDNFFDLGGASIQSIQVVVSAKLYGLNLSAEMIFEYQTIAELSVQIERK